jgi:antitoxin PrlF
MQGITGMATNLTSKGQVTVPKSVRDYLGLKPGAAVTFERLSTGEVVLRPVRRAPKTRNGSFAKLRGQATVKTKTVEQQRILRDGSGGQVCVRLKQQFDLGVRSRSKYRCTYASVE